MISSVIRCPYAQDIVKLFAIEDKSFQNDRASYTLEQEGDELVFTVRASDFVALRAMLNAITKNLSIYKKVGEIVEEENGE